MSRFENFVRLVQTEALFACLSRPGQGIRPSAIMSVALQCPMQSLSENTEGLRFQAEELVDWFFGGPDPEWLPEQLMFEEIEELVEEFIDPNEADGEFEYEFDDEYSGRDG